MRKFALTALLLAAVFPARLSFAAAPVSPATESCLDCHRQIHPGIVADWEKSRHARVTPAEALAARGSARRLSASAVPAALEGHAVGCAECHGLRPGEHADTFEHNGFDIHLVVSPGDCRTCHPEEASQYAENLMSRAYGNLAGNPVFADLEHTILGRIRTGRSQVVIEPAAEPTRAEGCYSCHGTKLKVAGRQSRATELAGELEFPVIEGWPNQGVGRVNLDGTLGSCAACHTRHLFSVKTARKPHTCKECHIGPDVPAFKVYEASKHGNLFSTHAAEWDFARVPWTVGRDFTAPTCAVCHVSALVTPEGETVARRTHRMNDRLPWRIFGLVYAHPHPLSPDTTVIRNAAGMPLPTDLSGKPAEGFLIGREEMERRRATLQAVCLSCHGSSWVNGFWARFEHTIAETNTKTRDATAVLEEIWKAGLAAGPPRGASPFDEPIERRWADVWLIYANTIRFASAMAGGGDYGVFADGRHRLNQAIAALDEWRRERLKAKTPAKP
ncbi:MAG: multiheme c-type cytochrome [Desulfobacterales bacterium]